MKASRDYFFERIGQLMEREDIYIVAADLAGRPFDHIRDSFPTKYVQVGIAEQNMISVSCGIALSGKRVIAYTANPFISFRSFDQVRNGVSLMNLPVTIAGVGVGFGISAYGPTHFVTEDFAMMSLCPNMRIVTVSDNTIAEHAVDDFMSQRSPLYLRFDKQCGDELAPTSNEEYERGFRYLRHGDVTLVLSTGYMSQSAMVDANSDASVIDLFQYPFDAEQLIHEVTRHQKTIVYEEQQKRGGLGSALLELFNEKKVDVDIELKAVNYGQRFPSTYGTRDYWLDQYHLSDSCI